MALRRLRQLAAIVETSPGVVNTGVFAAAQAQHLIRSDATMDADIPLFDRDILRASLTNLEGLAGKQMMTCKFSLELTGEASSGTPPWDIFMRACGWRSTPQSKITIGAITGGPFRHGELITQAVSAATARVAHDTYTGTTTLYVYDVTGTPNGTGIWTGGSTAATATPSTVETAAGIVYYPINNPTMRLTYTGSVTGTISVDEVITGGTSGAIGIVVAHDTVGKTIDVRVHNGINYSTGETVTTAAADSVVINTSAVERDIPALTLAGYHDGVRVAMGGSRGTWSYQANVGEPGIMTFDFKGLFGAVADVSNLSGITYPLKVPPVFLSAGLIFAAENSATTYSPRCSSVSLALNNSVEYREDANKTTGIMETVISNRGPNGSIDPELDLETSFPVIANFVAGTVSRMRWTQGTANGNKFLFSVPGAMYRQVQNADRAGIATRGIQFDASGGHWTNASNTAGADNEIVLSYITA